VDNNLKQTSQKAQLLPLFLISQPTPPQKIQNEDNTVPAKGNPYPSFKNRARFSRF
jgi:hypothetical protein